jgi:beta-glucosidase
MMADATFSFPTGFRWGTATAAYQVEGDNRNSERWQWEQRDRILKGHRSGKACDWWGGRWKEDLDRAAAAGQNAHRLSIEWSRLEPQPGVFDGSALDFYRDLLAGMRVRGIEPMVTLHHFSNPIWFAERGGWDREDAPQRFAAFVQHVVPALAEYADLWCTINEPNVYAYLAIAADTFPPGSKNIVAAFRVMRNMVLAHAAAYHAIHSIQPGARVGIAPQFRGMVPHSASPLDHVVTDIQMRVFNEAIMMPLQDGRLHLPLGMQRIPQAARTLDFIGVNYYTCEHVSFDVRRAGDLFGRRFYPKDFDVSLIGMNANVPDGMRLAIEWARSFHVPIYITENGIEDSTDEIRPRYLAQHVQKMWHAVNVGRPVKGYYFWSLVDNFEWERGWTQRFGLWELDPETQTRTERISAKFYAEICKQNALSSDMVRRYAPEILEKMFPE